MDRDRELLLRSARLYDELSRSSGTLRARGIKIAIVSNCSEHTRDLLESNGVAELADTLALSCEVGAEKPAAEIFTTRWISWASPRGTPCSWTTRRRTARARWAWASPRYRSSGASWTARCRTGHHGGPLAIGRRGDVLSMSAVRPLCSRHRLYPPGAARGGQPAEPLPQWPPGQRALGARLAEGTQAAAHRVQVRARVEREQPGLVQFDPRAQIAMLLRVGR